MVEKVLQLHINREKQIFWTLAGILLLCAGFYMYCINATIRNVVARQNFESEATALTLSIGKQEFQYITMRNRVTLDVARSLGFNEVLATTYISKKTGTELSYASRNF
jgi:hypothetical protein